MHLLATLTDGEINAALLPLDVPTAIGVADHGHCLECAAWDSRKYGKPLTRDDADTLRKMLYMDQRENAQAFLATTL